MSQDGEDGTRVTVRVGPDLESRIEDEREQGPYKVPKSEVVRAALKEYFDENSKRCRPA